MKIYIPQRKRLDFFLKLLCVFSAFLLVYLVWHFNEYPVSTPTDPFEDRRLHLQEMCEKHFEKSKRTTKDILKGNPGRQISGLSTYQMQHMYVDHRHRILYCFVPKVGCTNWKRIMMMLTGKIQVSSPMEIPRTFAHRTKNHLPLHLLNNTDREAVLNNYKGFLVVRDPMERILSAYLNKFESKTAPSHKFHREIGRKIIKTFRPYATPKEINDGTSVTFLEFVKYLTETEFSLNSNQGESYNEHWEPMNGLCNPCVMQYDYIARFENIVEESNMILKKLGSDIKYPSRDIIKPSGTADKMNKYFREIPLRYIRELERIYEMDHLLFNYKLLD